MNTKILLSVATLAASGVLVVGATFAFFSDSGTSNNNIFNSGTLDMKLTDLSEGPIDDVTATWGLASAPGDTFTGDLEIKNSGTVNANHIELKFTNALTEGTGSGAVATTPMDSVIEITTFGWDSDGNGTPDVDLLPGVSNINSNGIIDLDDLENQTLDDFDNLSFGGVQSVNHVLRIAGRLHPTMATNEHQGDSVDMDLAVTMNQDSSQ